MKDNAPNSEELYPRIKREISKILITNNKEIKMTEQATQTYESIEEYQKTTGKRFRIHREEKEKGLSREEAFALRFGKQPEVKEEAQEDQSPS